MLRPGLMAPPDLYEHPPSPGLMSPSHAPSAPELSARAVLWVLAAALAALELCLELAA